MYAYGYGYEDVYGYEYMPGILNLGEEQRSCQKAL
jgi:hypothetical protein